MGAASVVKLADIVKDARPEASLDEVRRIFFYRYTDGEWSVVNAVAADIFALFRGDFPGYHACDTDYHDIDHTISVLLAAARLGDGAGCAGSPLSPAMARDLLIAALCHDTGYIRSADENVGTGAKFTSVHVARSAAFAERFARRWGLGEESSGRISRIILATGLKGEFAEQDWRDDDERDAGAILASADLLGQMSDRAYLEKLLFLYYEFKEAGIPGYDTEFDILRKTMGFYEATLTRLDGSLGGVRKYARDFFKARHDIDADLYSEAVSNQMSYLREILDDESTNFRKKLKRMDLELSQPKTA